ncbi:MAG: Two-component transcriptional response regulator, LuxR family [uncultured Pyrinomonadaceae bacterium]|uniref:Two-component transcriptional response regulator, LuxR family n=1 Tax=uncultured Pyrinomonadaceae bacterium TaxID=2283094 RepID=A0A6J4P2G3_9BACT|nr:MAG: Two-component transcriptional response regulator, LuxR family [uncultured Pyrinomonadaceae bacterium]
MNKLKILLAEDHETVREGIRLIIESQDDLEVVGCAGDGREAIRLAEELKPDIVLMDVSMPKLNGLLATAKLKRIMPDVKILTLTRHTDEAYLQELLQAGVDGYVLKQSASTDLLRAVRAVAAGGNYLDPAITGKVFNNFTEKHGKMRGDVRGASLSGRESETLRLIALGYSNKEIAEQFDISVKTVEAHKANAQQKLNISSRKEIISYAILQGWMQEN